jgi:hypothetical protein
MADIQAGDYKGKVVTGSQRIGLSSAGKDTMIVTVNCKDIGPVDVRLALSEDAIAYSLEKLRACGWTGDRLTKEMPGLDKEEVTVRIKYESFTDAKGQRMVMKSDILSGAIGFKLETEETDWDAFAARVQAKTGIPVAGANAPKPKF